MLDHGVFHVAPPFPLLTKSVVPVMVQALYEIRGALSEVGVGHYIYRGMVQVEHIRLGHARPFHREVSKLNPFDLDTFMSTVVY
jgi:hypothetical protein